MRGVRIWAGDRASKTALGKMTLKIYDQSQSHGFASCINQDPGG